jgi:hypothetical protein
MPPDLRDLRKDEPRVDLVGVYPILRGGISGVADMSLANSNRHMVVPLWSLQTAILGIFIDVNIRCCDLLHVCIIFVVLH